MDNISYEVISHKRARSVKLKYSTNGLCIVIPPKFDKNKIPDILAKHSGWIEKQKKRYQAASEQISLPSSVTLPLIDQVIQINFVQTQSKSIRLLSINDSLLTFMGPDNNDLVTCKLNKWVKEKAKKILPIALKEISQLINIPFNHVSIRTYKSRWGSCSSIKDISLNYKLILLPKELANYVLIHELCHIKHLNHSDKFWKLVSKYDPNYLAHRKQLNQTILPAWLDL